MNTQLPEASALAACPHCGSTAIVIGSRDVTRHVQARCGFCFAAGPAKDTKADAIRAWNQRASQPQSAGYAGERAIYLWANGPGEWLAFSDLYPRDANGDPRVLGEPSLTLSTPSDGSAK